MINWMIVVFVYDDNKKFYFRKFNEGIKKDKGLFIRKWISAKVNFKHKSFLKKISNIKENINEKENIIYCYEEKVKEEN